MGVGNVGSKLLEQIEQQQPYLIDKLHLEMKVVGLANSKKMIFKEEGIDLENWKDQLKDSKMTSNLDEFYNAFSVIEKDQHFMPVATRVRIW